MAAYAGVLVSDPWLQNQFTQVELRTLKSSFISIRRESDGGLKLADLPGKMSRLKHVGETLTEHERAAFLLDSYHNLDVDVDFELFLRVYLKLQALATEKRGIGAKNASAFLKSPTSTLLHTISESEKASYVAHINNYLADNSSSKPRRQFHFYPLTHSCFCFPPALLASDLCIQSLNFLGLCIYPFIHIASLSTDSAPCIHLIDEIAVIWCLVF